MREVSQVFKDGFALGLRPARSIGPDTQYLQRAYNVVPTALGLVPRPPILAPNQDIPSQQYPFPILFCGSRHNLVFTATDLYSLTEDWELSHIAHQEWGGVPQIADFMDYVVWATPTGSYAYRDGILSTSPGGAQFRSCANLRGQLVVGNCSLPKGPEKVDHEVWKNRIDVGGENVVAWSKIGSIDWEYSLSNEVGWAPMPWSGSVLGLLPLGQDMMVYGSDGIAKLSSITEPTPTFGVSLFGTVGVKNRQAFAGDESFHVFIGTDNALYTITPERALSAEGKAPQRLGYEEFLENLKDPIVTFDPVLRHWWIGDEQTCYIYSGTGLGEASETPSRLNRVNGELLGYSFGSQSRRVEVETNPISFDSRGIKTLMCVEGDLTSSHMVQGFTRYRYNYSRPMQASRPIRLDPRGAFFPIIAGVEISTVLVCEDFQNFYLTKLWLHFKNTDKTFSRGVINAGRPAE